MKILVTIKRVPDSEQKLKVEQGRLDLSKANWQTNQFDEYALEAALRLVENVADPAGPRLGEVLVVSLGPKELQSHLRTALAMGADRAILIDAQEETLDANAVARSLVEIVKKESPDLVLMGKLGADHEGNEVGQRLAAYLGWPQASFASSIVFEQDRHAMLVGREIDVGIEYKRVLLPAVLTVDLRIISPKAVRNAQTPLDYEYPEGARYASLKGIMAAKKKTLVEMPLEDVFTKKDPWAECIEVSLPAPRKAGVLVDSATELFKKLHEEAKVL